MLESIRMKTVRTRIAPSPTGQDLHIGNAYAALVNYVFAKKHKGQFIVRVEDTDRSRLVERSEERILTTLAWLGVVHDEGPDKSGPYAPYRQSERLQLYKKHAEELIKNGLAYYCFCTHQRLEEMRKDQESKHLPPMYDGLCKNIQKDVAKKRVEKGEKHVIRLNVPDNGTTLFYDVIRGDISFENKLLDDQVLLKSDGFPTYHLGVVVDDHIMEITHIVRGEEWISSTPKHVLLFQFFGWELPVYAHIPVLRNPDKSKLSKRKNPVWVSWYREQGFLPEAIRNYLALMAWSHPEGKEIFPTEEFIEKFALENIQTTAPVFDIEKLRWMNGEYFRGMTNAKCQMLIYEFFENKYSLDQIERVLPLVRERMKTLKEFESLAGFFFEKPQDYERSINKEILSIVKNALTTSVWKHDAMEAAIRDAAEKAGKKAKDLFMELRVAVTGKTVGPPLLKSLEILEKEETISRLNISV